TLVRQRELPAEYLARIVGTGLKMPRTRTTTGIQPRAFPGPGTTVGEQVTLPDGRVMEWNGTTWVQVGGGGGGTLVDPTTTLGDLLVRGTTAVQRLAAGANNQVLTVDTAAPLRVAWKAGGGTYVHTESAPDADWVIPHNLNFQYVSVLTVSDAGDWIIG